MERQLTYQLRLATDRGTVELSAQKHGKGFLAEGFPVANASSWKEGAPDYFVSVLSVTLTKNGSPIFRYIFGEVGYSFCSRELGRWAISPPQKRTKRSSVVVEYQQLELYGKKLKHSLIMQCDGETEEFC
jgi:hypothetical protein